MTIAYLELRVLRKRRMTKTRKFKICLNAFQSLERINIF